MTTVLRIFRRGSAMFPHDIDLESVDGSYRPVEAVDIQPEDTFMVVTSYQPTATPERIERDEAARAYRERHGEPSR